jgi:hypothetical protein
VFADVALIAQVFEELGQQLLHNTRQTNYLEATYQLPVATLTLLGE